MIRNVWICALASAAMGTVASAGPGGHGGGGGGEGRGALMSVGGGGGGGADAGSRGMGGFGGIGDASTRGAANGRMNDVGATNSEASRINSQALMHASKTGIDHASENSVLAGTISTPKVTSGALSGLTAGTTLYSNGVAVGTVQQIRTRGNGAAAIVLVKGTNGGIYAVPASKLTLSGGRLSTTARLNGINASTTVAMNGNARVNSQGPAHASATGRANANFHSVLAQGSTTGTSTTTTHRRMNSQGPLNASATGIAHASSRSVLAASSGARTLVSAGGASLSNSGHARLNSQGPMHASATGIAHANSHSVLAGSAGSTLTGVSVGMPLLSNGTKVGTVTRVVASNGVIERVFVQGTSGRTYSLSPRTLSASGGTLTTSVAVRGM